jgi:HAD domain in Swiss Army Knife RNA repair proteins
MTDAGWDGRPWLLLDIDGVLNPTGSHAERGFTAYRLRGHDLEVQLNPEHGRMLNALDREGLVDLRWATTWNEAANRAVAPVIGLHRPLPVVPIDRALAGPVAFGNNWKAASVLAQTDGQPFAWLDDFMTEADRVWAEARVLDSGTPTLLVRIDPEVGLLPAHLDQVRDWARSTSGPGPLGGPDLLRRTPELAANPVAQERAEWFARAVSAMPATTGGPDRVELATSLWDRCAGAIAAEHAAEPGTLRPTDEFARQALRRYLRGDGAAAMVWADRAALRAGQPHQGHRRGDAGRTPSPYRLVLPEQPGPDAGYQVQALVDSAVAEIGVNPEWQRTHRSVQLGPSAPIVPVTIRADRQDTSSNLTVAFGHGGRESRIPYDQLLRGGPEAALHQIHAASGYALEPAVDLPLSPSTDPALAPPVAGQQQSTGERTGTNAARQAARSQETSRTR